MRRPSERLGLIRHCPIIGAVLIHSLWQRKWLRNNRRLRKSSRKGGFTNGRVGDACCSGFALALFFQCWLAYGRGKPPRKGGEHNGKDHLPPGAHRRQTWAENRPCASPCAVHAEADPPSLPLDDR